MFLNIIKNNKKKAILSAAIALIVVIVSIVAVQRLTTRKISIAGDTLANAIETLDTTETVSFTEDKSNFVNPEKGFYGTATSEEIDEGSLSELRSKNISLVLIETDLSLGANGVGGTSDTKNKPLTTAKLAEIDNAFKLARKYGLKVIYRAAYTYDYIHKPEPRDKSVMLNHIAQLKPIFTANEDVLYIVQAGFLGPWGEWHSSYYGDSEETPTLAIRKEVLGALLDAVPKSRMVQIREPRFIRDMNNWVSITDANAFDGSALSRTAYHNDCLFSSKDDVGTYVDTDSRYATRAQELEWANSQTKYMAFGGETCANVSYSDSANAVAESEKLHAQYLNIEYHEDVIAKWKSTKYNDENMFNYMSRRLGYSYTLNTAKISSKVYAGGALHLILDIKNNGFGGLANERNLEVVLSNGTDTYKAKVNDDLRKWYKENGSMTKDLYFSVPSDIKLGSWNLYLNLPDNSESLKNNKDYSIRLSNAGIWNADTGYNTLKKGIIIEDGQLSSNVTTFKQIMRSETEELFGINTPVPVSSISLNTQNVELKTGESYTIVPTISPADAVIKNVTFSSSDPLIATVDSNGIITAVSEGEAKIIATAVSGGATSSCTVKVTRPAEPTVVPVSSISIAPQTTTLVKGQTLDLKVNILPDNATNKEVSFSSSNESIADVDNSGKVTALSAGNVTITATVIGDGKTASSSIAITQPVTGISISPSSLNMLEGTSAKVSASVIPSYANNKKVAYSSSNSQIAKVDSSGNVTAVSAGTTTIIATSDDGGKKASCSVAVSAPEPATVTSWSDVTPIATRSSGYARRLKVYNDSTVIYMRVEGSRLSGKTQFYIDTDNNSDTGFKTKWSASGADYLLENNYLYKYNGLYNSWSWREVNNNISIEKNSSNVSVAIPLSILGLSKGKTMHVGFLADDSNHKIIPSTSRALPAYTIK